MSTCRVCPAEILWAETVNGRAIPVDADPVEGGNVRITPRRGAAPLAEVLGPLERELEPAGTLHYPHHATCTEWGNR